MSYVSAGVSGDFWCIRLYCMVASAVCQGDRVSCNASSNQMSAVISVYVAAYPVISVYVAAYLDEIRFDPRLTPFRDLWKISSPAIKLEAKSRHKVASRRRNPKQVYPHRAAT